MEFNRTRNSIEIAIDRFEDAIRLEGPPEDDEYYHTLVKKIYTSVAEWMDDLGDRETFNGFEMADRWREEMGL